MARTNFSGPVASEQGFEGAVKLKSYLVGAAPPAAANVGAMVYFSNAAGGGIVGFSNGTNWMRVDTNAAVA